MWRHQHQDAQKTMLEGSGEEKLQQESHVDSGFLSGVSLESGTELTSDTDLRFTTSCNQEPEIAPEPSPTTLSLDSFIRHVHSDHTKSDQDDDKLHEVQSSTLDSGVDLHTTENVSEVSVKSDLINWSKSDVIHDKPTLEHLRNDQQQAVINYSEPQIRSTSSESKAKLWELYFSQDDDGDTQLHLSIIQGLLEASFYLINLAPHPVLLDIYNDDYMTALHLAVITKQADIVRGLVLAGCNPHLCDRKGNTALHLACKVGNFLCARALTEALTPMEKKMLIGRRLPKLPQNMELRNYDGATCIHLAALGGHFDVVRQLLRTGADVNAYEGLGGRTILHLGIELGRPDIVRFVLAECRPQLETMNYARLTAYQLAVLCGRQEIASELLRHGAVPKDAPESDEEDEIVDSEEESEPEEDFVNSSRFAVPVSMIA